MKKVLFFLLISISISIFSKEEKAKEIKQNKKEVVDKNFPKNFDEAEKYMDTIFTKVK